MVQMLKPKPAGPKAIRRWTRQALDLVGRGFHVWVALMVVLCLMVFGTQRSPFLGQILALTAYFVGIGISVLVDNRTHIGFFAILQRAWREAPAALFMGVVVLGLGTCSGLIFDLLFDNSINFKRFYDASAVLRPLSDDSMLAMRRLFGDSLMSFMLALVVMNVPFVSSPFQYHCMTILGTSWWEGYWNGNPLIEANIAPMFGFFAILFFTPLLMLPLAPFLAPIFFCFASAFSYVAFREIYLGISENRKIVATEARTLAGFSACAGAEK